jgi:uncharacterized protein
VRIDKAEINMKINRLFNLYNFLCRKPFRDAEKVRAVMKIYRQLDKEIAVFRRETKLRCLPRCGQCCESTKVEATVLEMIPLANELWRKGKGELWLQRIAAAGDNRRCVLYWELPQPGKRGRCSVYFWRPLVCRLFGFSAMKNKHGRSQVATCFRIRKANSLLCAEVQKRLDHGLPIPVMSDFVRRIEFLDMDLGVKLLPINQALQKALERVALAFQITQRQASANANR